MKAANQEALPPAPPERRQPGGGRASRRSSPLSRAADHCLESTLAGSGSSARLRLPGVTRYHSWDMNRRNRSARPRRDSEWDRRKILVGLKIRSSRRARGLTQHEVASRLRLATTKSVSMWERGQRLPDYWALLALSRLFNVYPTALLQPLDDYVCQDLGLGPRRAREPDL